MGSLILFWVLALVSAGSAMLVVLNRNPDRGSFLPMKTSTEDFLSVFAHGLPMSPPIIMCTPWNTTRRGLPFIHSTPL